MDSLERTGLLNYIVVQRNKFCQMIHSLFVKALDAFQQFILKQIKDRLQRSAEVDILVEDGKVFRQRINNDILGLRQTSDLVKINS